MKSDLFTDLPKSKLSVNELVEMSQRSLFKVSIKERSATLGKIKYIGYKPVFHRNSKKQLVMYISLYFYMKGSNVDLSKNKKGKTVKSKKKVRQQYLLVAKFPYNSKIKNMKRLYSNSLQLMSSDPSFKYFFAFALNKMNAVITDDATLVSWLGRSLKDAPSTNNPDLKLNLTKHFYQFFKFISNVRPKVYLDKKYLLTNDIKIVNPKV